jgi:hypothetical protein
MPKKEIRPGSQEFPAKDRRRLKQRTAFTLAFKNRDPIGNFDSGKLCWQSITEEKPDLPFKSIANFPSDTESRITCQNLIVHKWESATPTGGLQ